MVSLSNHGAQGDRELCIGGNACRIVLCPPWFDRLPMTPFSSLKYVIAKKSRTMHIRYALRMCSSAL